MKRTDVFATCVSVNLTLNCLGNWPGPNGSTYFALMDISANYEGRPQYRCGVNTEDTVFYFFVLYISLIKGLFLAVSR